MCQRQACETQIPEPLRRHRSLIAHSLLPLADKRRRVLRNLRQLEGLGLVSARNGYQGLVDGLAKVAIRGGVRGGAGREGGLGGAGWGGAWQVGGACGCRRVG